jgi:hypothetical protein
MHMVNCLDLAGAEDFVCVCVGDVTVSHGP